VASLTKRVRQLEEDFESTEARLLQTQLKLEQASKAADDSERSASAPACPCDYGQIPLCRLPKLPVTSATNP